MLKRTLRRLTRGLTAGEVAGRDTDPRFYSAMHVLPNPDPILRRMGRAHDIYGAIQSDAHVIGELRAIRAGLLNYEYRVAKGGDRPADARAAELCDGVLARRPAPNMTWADTIWNMGGAVFHGHRVHEVVWQYQGDLTLPVELLDRPGRRFVFGSSNELRVLSRAHPVYGQPEEDRRLLLTRHMPTYDNPYGVALFSSCFWPYTFKHSGFRWFVKYCERLGVPIPVGKYPAGSGKEALDTLQESLESLIESSWMMIEEGGNIELLEAKQSGSSLAQSALIDKCNREMSKALTSQTLATEQQDTGARAASETHHDRESSVNESDRVWIADTFDELFRWITEVNLGPDVAPPTFEFYEETEARKERAEVYEIAARIAPERISASGMLAELNIPEAEDDEDRLQAKLPPPPPGGQFSRGCPMHGGHEYAQGSESSITGRAAADADEAIEADLIDPIADMLDEFERDGRTLAEFQAALAGIYTSLDTEALERLTEQVMAVEFLKGAEAIEEDQ